MKQEAKLCPNCGMSDFSTCKKPICVAKPEEVRWDEILDNLEPDGYGD